MHMVNVLTVSSGLPMALKDALLTRAEAVLNDHGASRIWIDPAQPGTTVLAEFPAAPASVVGDLVGGVPA
ncbi:hypothetical protein [Nocardioides sp. YIM 152315]|uniref:hypothetical protein n=1 Tax=Nocardioides sp. YIM 152315 TaxID=3031760 RepID=UPI0023DB4C30|nr:hypothetical protein [Nocardioides sp. YIM 152315]MDF1603167.1 hypothetical protein [Nocardioides sp. YIM 152315]